MADPSQGSEEATRLLSATDELLSEIEGARGLFTTAVGNPELHRQVSAAALVRAVALLRSGLALIRAEQTEGVGVVARSAWEAWLVGTYLLAGGRDSLHRLAAESLRQNDVLADRNALAPEVLEKLARDRAELEDAERDRLDALGIQVPDTDSIKFERLTVETIARQLGPMLVASGLEESADVLSAYDLFYRSHSAYDSHGMPALERHLDVSQKGLVGLVREPPGWIEPHRTLGVVAMYVSSLAHHLYVRFGIGVERLELVQEQLLDVMRAGADSALTEAATRGLPGDWDRFRE